MTRAMQTDREKRVRFDGTVNLGHILTFLGFLATGGAMWATVDKRVTVLEDARVAQRALDARQDNDITGNKQTVREDLKEISAKLDRLIERR